MPDSLCPGNENNVGGLRCIERSGESAGRMCSRVALYVDAMMGGAFVMVVRRNFFLNHPKEFG